MRAIVAGEPATVLYTGMLTTGEYGPRLEIMANAGEILHAGSASATLEKLKTAARPC